MSPRATSTHFLNTYRHGDSITFLVSLFQCLVASTTRLGRADHPYPGGWHRISHLGNRQCLTQPILGVIHSPICDSPNTSQTRGMAASPHYSSWLSALPEESQRSSDKRPAQLGAAKLPNLQGRQINRKVISMPGQPSEQTFPRSHHKGRLAEQALQSLDIEPREGGGGIKKEKEEKKPHQPAEFL